MMIKFADSIMSPGFIELKGSFRFWNHDVSTCISVANTKVLVNSLLLDPTTNYEFKFIFYGQFKTPVAPYTLID